MTDLIAKLTADKAEHEKQREQAIAQANMLSGAILQIEAMLAYLQQPAPEPANGKEPETEAKKDKEQSNG